MGVKLKNFENNKYFFENTGILTVQNIGIKDFAQRKLPCKDFNDCIISVRGTNQTNGEVLKNPLLYMNSNAHIWHICLCMVPLSCNTYIYEFVPLNIVKGYIHLRIILRNHQFILKYHNINYLSPFFKRKYIKRWRRQKCAKLPHWNRAEICANFCLHPNI